MDEHGDQMQKATLAKGGLRTVPQAMEFLQVSRSRIYAMFEAGELEYVLLGRSRRVPQRSLELCIERNLTSRTAS